MKKICIILLVVQKALFSFAQTDSIMTVTQRDSILTDILLRLEKIEYKTEPAAKYKLYKTENIYNLLKLDTATGQIEQLQ